MIFYVSSQLSMVKGWKEKKKKVPQLSYSLREHLHCFICRSEIDFVIKISGLKNQSRW